MANAFLAHLENNLLCENSSLTCIPTLFLRYVDDCFALFNNSKDAESFLFVLNSLHRSVKFTLEKGGTCMPFLDVVVKINGDTFETSVYRKSTHTGVFLNFKSIVPTAWKKGVILCLLYRAKVICSSISLFDAEINNLRKMFVSNAYPVSFFDNVVSSFHAKFNRMPTECSTIGEENEDLPIIVFNVPYFGKVSRIFANDISKLISRKFPVKVRIVYSSFKVKSYFVLKCFSPFYLSSNIVYRFNCMSDSCSDTYIGYTSRHLFERCDEEHLNLKSKKQSEIKDHIRKCSVCNSSTLSYSVFSIVRRCRSEVHAKLFEAFAIKRFRPSLNVQLFAQGASKILHIWK